MTTANEILLKAQTSKIQAIKDLRKQTSLGLSLKEAKDVVDEAYALLSDQRYPYGDCLARALDRIEKALGTGPSVSLRKIVQATLSDGRIPFRVLEEGSMIRIDGLATHTTISAKHLPALIEALQQFLPNYGPAFA